MYEQNGEGKWTNMIRINQINLKAGPALAEREEELLKSKIKRLLKLTITRRTKRDLLIGMEVDIG